LPSAFEGSPATLCAAERPEAVSSEPAVTDFVFSSFVTATPVREDASESGAAPASRTASGCGASFTSPLVAIAGPPSAAGAATALVGTALLVESLLSAPASCAGTVPAVFNTTVCEAARTKVPDTGCG
jgi:hypothetical protein